ncbi:hypothetical protein GQ43DRAFT_439533 [Delitschia confertaspora ATCC 74209]|uniref:Uncharacterized protein n=1 Tax=Delitschia confertaspora ATCC 74209 TaxID=1513339 RepID=A0A9P4MWY6_9PLEO|nr:hypothetical protein GQ43DRAFT_439533 [Delitschia confertaspora ATCC 74209]
MRFATLLALTLTATLGYSAAVPNAAAISKDNQLNARSCDCECLSHCNEDCANGFALNPIGQGLCGLTCGDSCGCGPNEVCCTNGQVC